MQERTARIERAEGDEAGRFSMVLATEGEASDGDILSIKGGKIPARMPLLLSHWNDPTATAGSVTHPQKELGTSPPRLRAVGEIEMEGEGGLADIRRDVAFMIDKGHVGAVSIRWDEVEGGKPPVRRVNLPSDHPAFINAETETSWRKRSGLFWPQWRALEGSIVALGADPEALIGRGLETKGRVREFWNAMADDAKERDDGTADVKAALVALGLHVDECREIGATPSDILNAILRSDGNELETIEIAGTSYCLPTDAVAWIETRTSTGNTPDPAADDADQPVEPADPTPEPDPEPASEAEADQPSVLRLDAAEVLAPVDLGQLGQLMSDALDEHEKRIQRYVTDLLDLRTGKVPR